MVGKLDPEERVLPSFFKETSSDPYLRHDYKLVYSNGKYEIFDNYMDVFQTWMNTPSNLFDYVEVLDHKKPKNNKSGGFK